MVKSKIREGKKVITPNNPVHMGLLAEKDSLDYRRRIMHIANIMRLVFALMCLLFAPLFLSGDATFIWNVSFTAKGAILLFGCLYIICLSGITLYSVRGRGHEHLFIINAVVDAFFVILFLVTLDLNNNLIWLIAFVVISIVLSLLTLNILQCAIYALLSYVIIMTIYLLWAIDYLGWLYGLSQEMKVGIFSLWEDSNNKLVSIAVIFAILALIIFLVGYLANNARENGIMAKLNRIFYEQSQSLNQSIIAEMPSGLIVLNMRNEIITMNRVMRERFRIKPHAVIPLYLNQLSPLLERQLTRWLDLKHNDLQPLDLFGEKFTATFTPLPIEGYETLLLISLENVESSYQRVRETRLASLGRLTAGIAHEIRNPLGSIQSANELIAEWKEDDNYVQKLSNKILANSKRINAIISDILDMFSDRPSTAQLLNLNEFLISSISNSRADNDLEHIPIKLNIENTKSSAIFFDPSHLSQILHNLMLNAIKHSGRKDVAIVIETRIGEGGRSLYLDVMDNGCGVSENMQERIFEPFYSSSREGTGLGLYLVREMCLANQAHIIYVSREKGACFRIIMERYQSDNE